MVMVVVERVGRRARPLTEFWKGLQLPLVFIIIIYLEFSNKPLSTRFLIKRNLSIERGRENVVLFAMLTSGVKMLR